MSEGRVILVVEDNPVTRKMLRVALETEGYAVVEAGDTRSAFASASARLPDLVIQDLILPDGEGFELARRIRALEGGDRVPILAVSGFSGSLTQAQTAGFSTMLQKPVEPSRLIEAVSALLPRPAGSASRDAQGLRLLIVDDDPLQLKLELVHFTQLGFQVTTAASAIEAVRAAKRSTPDVILSDVLMPELDGYELCLELASDPELSRVPVVLVSARYDSSADAELARQVGANALVARTPNPDQIAPVLIEAARTGRRAPSAPTPELRSAHTRAVSRQLGLELAASVALERRVALQAAQIALLGGIADALSHQGDTDAALRDVLAATLDAAAISKGALFLRGQSNALRLRHAIGFSDTEQIALHGFFGEAHLLEQIVQAKVPVGLPSPAVADAATQRVLVGANTVSARVVPLVSGRNGIGAIVLAAKSTDLTSEDATVFARAIGNQIVQSLEIENSFRRLAESEQRYRALMENAREPLSVLTADGTFREVNRRLAEILGVSKDQVVGRHVRDFAERGREDETVENFGRSVAGEARRARPLSIRRADGSRVLVEFANTAMEIAGERLVFSVGRDVTEELRHQSQMLVSERMVSVGMLAAGVAHEINNPLSAVVANLELAARDLESMRENVPASRELAEIEAEVRDAREAADHVRSLVRDLKVFSRAEEDTRTPVHVHRVIDSSIRMAWNEIRHRAQLIRDYGPVPLVLANESRLAQVFLNLIVNAAQAIPEGRANSNEVRIRTWTDAEGRAVIVVSDTGPGVPQEMLQQIFAPFFTTKPLGVGTGLGLTICHRIVTDVGGQIEVRSEPGRGAEVHVTLPPTRAKAEEAGQPMHANEKRKGRILIVDDEALVGMAVRRALTPDHDVVYVSSAGEALARLSGGEAFDLVLCDLMMPVMTGMDLYAQLLEKVPEVVPRIVFLTGGAFTPRARAFLDQVPNARIEKPFDLTTLENFVQSRLA